jgi:hypothetical protein
MRNGFWQFVYDWQTLGAGLLALAAGVGTIAVTRVAARGQIKVTRDQIVQSQNIERRRIARETYAFAETLRASMELVVEQAKDARSLVPNLVDSPQVYDARQRIKKTGFGDLRTSFIRLGGELTEPFLRLDAEIDHFASQWFTRSGTTTDTVRFGKQHRFEESLERIVKLANALAEAAVRERERNKQILEITAAEL